MALATSAAEAAPVATTIVASRAAQPAHAEEHGPLLRGQRCLPVPKRIELLHNDLNASQIRLGRSFCERLKELILLFDIADTISKRRGAGAAPNLSPSMVLNSLTVSYKTGTGSRKVVNAIRLHDAEMAEVRNAVEILTLSPSRAIGMASLHIQAKADGAAGLDDRLLLRYEFGIALLYLVRASGQMLNKRELPDIAYFTGFRAAGDDTPHAKRIIDELNEIRDELQAKRIPVRHPDPDVPLWNTYSA